MRSLLRFGFERKARIARDAYHSNSDFLLEELTRFRLKHRIAKSRWRPVEIAHFLHWSFTFTAERSRLRSRLKDFLLLEIGKETADALMRDAQGAEAGTNDDDKAAALLHAIERMESRESRYGDAWSADIERGEGLLVSRDVAMPKITQVLLDGVFNNGGKRKHIHDHDGEVDGLVSDVICTAAVMYQKMS